MSPKLLLAKAKESRKKGNQLFAQQKWSEAVRSYEEALSAIEVELGFMAADCREAKENRIPCFTNMAECFLRMKDFHAARECCSKALDIDPQCIKALFRRGAACARDGMFAEARRDLDAANELSPGNKTITKELALLQVREERHRKKEQKIFKGLFEKSPGIFAAENERDSNDAFIDRGTLSGYFGPWAQLCLVWIRRYIVQSSLALGSVFSLASFLGGRDGSLASISQQALGALFTAAGFLQWYSSKKTSELLPSWSHQRRNLVKIAAATNMILGLLVISSRQAGELQIITRCAAILVGAQAAIATRTFKDGRDKRVNPTKVLSIVALLLWIRRHAL